MKEESASGKGNHLFENEAVLHALLEGSPLPTFVIDVDHHILYWNKALEKLSGIRAVEVTGTRKHWMAFYDEERPCMADLLIDGRIDEIPEWYEGKFTPSTLIPDAYEAVDFFPALGEKGKWLRFTAAALRIEGRGLVGAVETLEDITDRKRADEGLLQSEQLLKVVIEGSPIPTFVIDGEHRIVYWNRALVELSGIKAEVMVGTNNQWMAFYNTERPCMADLLVNGRIEEIPGWYEGIYTKSKLIPHAYEATDFFPALGKDGRWLRFTAAALYLDGEGLVGAVETLEDITERKRADEALKESEQRYRRLSITDALTKLYNSRQFYIHIRAETDRANRYKHPLALLMLDIDNFKSYNDTYGHLEGDAVLVRLGRVMRRCLRKTDFSYRFGGEEFTALLPETQGDAAIVLAERIRYEFERETYQPTPDEQPRKTVSIGIAEYKEGEDITDFLKRADQNMYRAKKQGKNRVYLG